MKFREWFETQQAAGNLYWADEEAAATAWGAALEEAAEAAIAAGEAAAETYGDGAECLRTAEFAAERIRALKEQA